MTETTRTRLAPPSFDLDSALAKVQAAEDAWNTRDPWHVSLGYSPDSEWRNRDTFITGRDQIVDFLTAKFRREHAYALRKGLWAFHDNHIAVRFQYEWHDEAGQWWRSYGNELWEFDEQGLNRRREGSINDVRISEEQRRIFGPRPPAERGVDFPLR
ncbi:conserved hypothetical protein [uncultured Mycobacterium sp.]|uniref:Response regulator receiver domain-containing protein n=1 Tax=uncultured Mycobacterium sp. TaxID=171292 RepID=A0A1Y5PKK8_9MYCO|nr:conserved hypothetical protein [uncultured Mycobacterium sp.]